MNLKKAKKLRKLAKDLSVKHKIPESILYKNLKRELKRKEEK